MEKRKVLFVAHHLTIGGAQKSLVSALKAIDYEQNDVTLYVRKNRLDLLPEIDSRVNVIVNKDDTHYYRNVYAVWMVCRMKLCGLLKRKEKKQQLYDKLSDRISRKMMEYESTHYFQDKQYDIAISYVQGYTADLVAEAIRAEKKFIFYHSSTDEAHEFHERIFAKYDRIIAVGEQIRKIVQTLYPTYADKVDVLNNYVDYKAIRDRADQAVIHTPEGIPALCSCGRLNAVKGFDLAVEAAKLMKDSGERFMWYFVGDGPERGRLEDMIRRYELEDSITITGMQANPYPWIKACDIYVQPSYEEAYGLSMAEALILCKPVVTTATVGGRILIRDGVNGLICDINGRAVAETVERLMNDPELAGQMVDLLSKADRSREFDVYRAEWSRILKG